ncbi:MAG: tripartite tricarboxylate transporter substrate binding protein [Burkholderiaceae bacterium]|nr:tripartite tricarboxylate transporter substrate binding protein [Burkholderiaceae bacterium]
MHNLKKYLFAGSIAFGLAVGAAAPAPALAEGAFKPTGPVRIVVPFPPGGGTDAMSRIVGEKLGEIWQQPVIIENRSGAQGNVGTAYALKTPPDGMTWVVAHQGVLTVNPFLYKKDLGFDVFKDMTPIGRATQQPFVLVANPKVPVSTLKELETMARAQPGKFSFGSSAAGPQLAVEMFKHTTGVQLLHVAYKGAGPAVIDVLAGNIDMLVANPASIAQHVKSGKLKALVAFGDQPVAVLPGVATAPQAGYPMLGDIPEWYGFGVPAGTPAATVQLLNKDLNTALSNPDVVRRLSELGLNASPTTTAEFASQIRRDNDRWGKLIREAGVRIDG